MGGEIVVKQQWGSGIDHCNAAAKRDDQGIWVEVTMRRRIARAFADKQCKAVLEVCCDRVRLSGMPVNEFMNMLVA